MDFEAALLAALGELHDRQAETLAKLDWLLERFGPNPIPDGNTSGLDEPLRRPVRLEGCGAGTDVPGLCRALERWVAMSVAHRGDLAHDMDELHACLDARERARTPTIPAPRQAA